MPIFDGADANKIAAYLKGELVARRKKGIHSAALLTVREIQTRIIPNLKPTPVDRGTSRAGWRAETTEDGADVVNTVPQTLFIDQGVPAASVKIGRAMITALAEWARRKGMLGKGAKRGSEEGESVAWGIAMNMRKRGIFQKGQGFQFVAVARAFFVKSAKEEIEKELSK